MHGWGRGDAAPVNGSHSMPFTFAVSSSDLDRGATGPPRLVSLVRQTAHLDPLHHRGDCVTGPHVVELLDAASNDAGDRALPEHRLHDLGDELLSDLGHRSVRNAGGVRNDRGRRHLEIDLVEYRRELGLGVGHERRVKRTAHLLRDDGRLVAAGLVPSISLDLVCGGLDRRRVARYDLSARTST